MSRMSCAVALSLLRVFSVKLVSPFLMGWGREDETHSGVREGGRCDTACIFRAGQGCVDATVRSAMYNESAVTSDTFDPHALVVRRWEGKKERGRGREREGDGGNVVTRRSSRSPRIAGITNTREYFRISSRNGPARDTQYTHSLPADASRRHRRSAFLSFAFPSLGYYGARARLVLLSTTP